MDCSVEDTGRDGGDGGWPGCDDVLLLYLVLCFVRHDMMGCCYVNISYTSRSLGVVLFFLSYWSLWYRQGERIEIFRMLGVVSGVSEERR